ncbi:alpha/beta fold hydrolase [Arthrobacter sp. zg-Y750]|uniref:alpha/beta fold hydrolase n=1 Tax=Arthrobacter sp. zg-Y750 TaxID=2894189 RepID=UPI001E2DF127|nr:alpha/beta fold hydrolase [Arthrobacter sp. zg-Y750]MCC9178587.1 alpha/beta fold hydrolase [Arthrobacter sp. zg-Y750]
MDQSQDGLPERHRAVRSGGAELAVYEYGPPPSPGSPSLLLVHGYPDDHRVFQAAVRRLAAGRHVIAYDTRNAGASRVDNGTAAGLSPYRLPALVDDLYAVLAATGTGPVHLVGHDWGSIQGWAAISDPRAADRILSYTSISGPDLAHFRHWLKVRLRSRLWPEALNQALRSSYVAAFQLPVLPEAAWKYVLTPRYEKSAGRRIGDNAARGLQLYRANMFTAARPPEGRYTGPVQVVVPLKDPFLSPKLVSGLQERFPGVETVEVDAGHWWPEQNSSEFADLLDRWLARHPGTGG